MKEENKTVVNQNYLLSEVNVGSVGIITKINATGPLRRRILDMELTPNTQVFLRKKAPLGDPLEITLRGYELTLRKEEASNIEVKVTEIVSEVK